MSKWCYICLFFSLVLTGQSQQEKKRLQLFYDIDQYESEKNFVRTDSFISSLDAGSVTLKLYGYADYLGNSEYNVALSKRRVNAIKNHLLKKYPSSLTVLSEEALGEKFSHETGSGDGETSQRRVDIVVHGLIQHETDVKPVKKEEKKTPPAVSKQPTEALRNLEKGKTITLEGLSFIPGRHFILKSSLPILDKLLATLKENPDLKIEIQGHVCCADGEEDGLDYDTYDHKLSHNRAKTVYDYLVKNGVDKERLSYKGFGHSKPKVFPEKNEDDEQMNRRVEILVLED